VHLYGQSCDMNALTALARKHRLKIVEDCAHSTGATYHRRKPGSIGDCGAFSFYPTKNLGAHGDGGAVTTNVNKIYEKLLLLRNYGKKDSVRHVSDGINSRLDELQAAILRKKLKFLNKWNAKRRALVAVYRRLLPRAMPLRENRYGRSVYHLFVVRSARRGSLRARLQKANVETWVHYLVPVHKQKAFEGKGKSLPVAEKFASQILSLPLYPKFSRADVVRIAVLVRKHS
jgi:dTDP-4-amino-4,6-dideoxygalactose transaminase